MQAVAPDGGSLLVGNSKGRLHQYDIVMQPAAAGTAVAAAAGGQQLAQQPGIDEGSKRELKCPGSCHGDTIDCMVSLALAEGPVGLLPACLRCYVVLPCHACLLLC